MTVVDMEAVNEVEYNFGKSSKAPKDMNAPKKPLSAFFLWANHARAGVQIEHPGASIGEIGMLLGNLWKIVSEDERERFVIQAEKNKVLYEREKEKYQKSARKKSSRACRRRVARRTRAPKGPNSSTLYHQRRARGEKTPKPETSDQRKTPLRPPKHKNKFWSRRRIARLVKKRVSELGTLMHKKYSEPKKKARVAVNNDKGYRKASARREKKRIEKCTSPRRQTSASRGTSRRRRARRRSHRSRSKSNTSSRRTEASKIVRRSRTPKGRTRKRTTRRTKRSKRKSRKRFYSRSRSISHSRNSQRSSSRYTKSRSRKRSSRTTARKGKRVRRHRRSIQENYTSAEETTVKVYKKPVLEDSESDYVIEGSEGFVLEDSEGIVEDSERLAVVGCIEEVPSVVQVDPETTGNEETESEPVL